MTAESDASDEVSSAWSAGSDPLFISWGEGQPPARDKLERLFERSNLAAELTLLIAIDALAEERKSDFLLEKALANLEHPFVLPLQKPELGIKWAILSLKIWLLDKETCQSTLRTAIDEHWKTLEAARSAHALLDLLSP